MTDSFNKITGLAAGSYDIFKKLITSVSSFSKKTCFRYKL